MTGRGWDEQALQTPTASIDEVWQDEEVDIFTCDPDKKSECGVTYMLTGNLDLLRTLFLANCSRPQSNRYILGVAVAHPTEMLTSDKRENRKNENVHDIDGIFSPSHRGAADF